jgi:hypothetical protein
VVELSERLVHSGTDLTTLKSGGGGKNGDFGGSGESVDALSLEFLRARFVSRAKEGKGGEEDGTHATAVDVSGDVVANFSANDAGVLAEVLGSQTELDELLLLHENVVGDVVDNLGTENAARKGRLTLGKGK